MIVLLVKVQVPPVTVWYFAVNVWLPALRPLTRYVAPNLAPGLLIPVVPWRLID